jgi:hypothetical protein
MYTCISFPHDVDTTGGQQLQSAFFLEWGYHWRRSPIQVPWLSRCCCTSVLEIEGTGVSTLLGRWLWNLVCFVWSDNLMQTLMWYMSSPTQSHPTPNHPHIPTSHAVAWITGPATDPRTDKCHGAKTWLTWFMGKKEPDRGPGRTNFDPKNTLMPTLKKFQSEKN